MESLARSLALSTGAAANASILISQGIANTTRAIATSSTGSELVANSTLSSSWNSTPGPTITSAINSAANFSTFATSNSTTTANPYFNGTDLNNATQCWPAYWSYSSMTSSWSRAHAIIVTRTVTYTSTIESGVPEPSPNSTYSFLCDGLPRFGSDGEAANATVLLPTPITSVYSYGTVDYTWPTGENFPPAPSCSIRNADECSAAWSLFGSSLASSNAAWRTSNILTVSLASPPTSVVVNSKATPLTAAPGAFPTLTLHGEEYGAEEGTYTISGGVNLYGEVTITPGGQQVLTWNQGQVQRPFGPTVGNCTRPGGNIIQSQCATAQCTIGANSVELLYFPPPSTSRDLCANTSPGFNSYSVPIFSQPHASTIINSSTYWYDKAYVRYDTVSAYKWCALDNQLGSTSVPVGGTYSKRLVEVSSSDVSSICDWRFNPTRPYGLVIGATAKPFNFEDLVGDLPAPAYQCIPSCQSGCNKIISSSWIPGLAVPPQVRAQDPEWASCVPQFDGVPDPPIALKTDDNPLTSNTPSESRPSNPPTPGQSVSTGPSATILPITQPPVTTRFTSTISRPTSRPPPNDPGVSADPDPTDPNDPRPSVSRPNNPSPNNPSPNDPPQNNPDPANTVPPSPQDPPSDPQTITNPPAGPTAIGTIGNSIINTDPSRPGTIVISDPDTPGGAQTLTAGSDPIVISGTTVSVDPTSGAIVVSGDSTLQPIGIVNGKPVFTDPNRPGIVIIGDPDSGQPTQTLSVSGPTVVIDGETLTLSPTAAAQSSTTFAGLSIVVLADGTVVINNTRTIKPGDPETIVDGHKVLVDPSGAIWVNGQRVQTLPVSSSNSASATAQEGIATDPILTDSTGKDGPSPTTQEMPQNSSLAIGRAPVPRIWGLVGLVAFLAVLG